MRSVVVVVFVLIVAPMWLGSTMIGFFSSPWAPWWFSGKSGIMAAGSEREAVVFGPNPTDVAFPSPPEQIGHGAVSDAMRYQLARAAGFNAADAIIATALSIAEDGSGDPTALSRPNRDGSRDLGLWQINSVHWPRFGGPTALVDPMTNARAAFAIFGPGRNWCAWSTYEESCGPGHTGSYRGNLTRARAASTVSPPTAQG